MNPLEGDFTQGPLMPRLMEMDIVGKRQPEALLGELTGHWISIRGVV